MSFTRNLNKNWKIFENVIFILAFGFILYGLITSYWQYIYDSIQGKGYLGAIIDPILSHEYYRSFISVIIILNSTCVLWEIVLFTIELIKQERVNTHGFSGYKSIFKKVAVNYKSSFLTFLMIHQLLPKLILLHMFWIWFPYIQKFGLFTTNLQWYSWIYGYLIWEFANWVFHYSSHRVRLLWCLHAPHHAPSELNMTVNWVHFFAETYYSNLVLLVFATLLGVNPVMFLALMSIESAWGMFIHVSDRALKNGNLGILQHLIITPSHHRVHHAKNPLYMDTNFASVVPLWDWLFGTLQPLKKEVDVDYGITRELDVTNFMDLYFGELFLLYSDVKNAAGVKNKLLYIVKPPGWTPASSDQTAAALRREFLKTNPDLGINSKDRFLAAISKRGQNTVEYATEIPDSGVGDIQ